MLSPHEIATLMVLGHPQPPAGMDPEDIRVLVERRPVQLDARRQPSASSSPTKARACCRPCAAAALRRTRRRAGWRERQSASRLAAIP